MNEVVQMLITKPKILKVAKVMAQMRWWQIFMWGLACDRNIVY
jgi:hypothetical protein